ncbi:MAG: T9SS type A sorting domain-containing protein [Candidatus Latescibacteria bacterium]|nr:T9SS type A sorting domain-containing protein [Candidatus Latescibacterota bacterium]
MQTLTAPVNPSEAGNTNFSTHLSRSPFMRPPILIALVTLFLQSFAFLPASSYADYPLATYYRNYDPATPVVAGQVGDHSAEDHEGQDYSGADAQHMVDLSGANFLDANLSYANLNYTILGTLKRADLHGADLQGADLSDLRNADLRGANFSGATFSASGSFGGAYYDVATVFPNNVTPTDAPWLMNPVLVGPIDHAVVSDVNVTFEWTPVAEAASCSLGIYEIIYDEQAGTSTPQLIFAQGGLTLANGLAENPAGNFTFDYPLTDGKNYQWEILGQNPSPQLDIQLKAVEQGNKESPFGHFSVDVTPPADLITTAVEIISPPDTLRPGAQITMRVTVKNQGTAPTPLNTTESIYRFRVGAYHLADTTAIDWEDRDQLMGAKFINGQMAPGEVRTVDITATLPTELRGSGFVGAYANYHELGFDEQDKSNNTLVGETIELIGEPDLVTTQVDILEAVGAPPYSFMAGETITLRVTVENQGTAPTILNETEPLYRFRNAAYLSVSDTIDWDDATLRQAARFINGQMAAGEVRTVDIPFSVPAVPVGTTYYVGAYANFHQLGFVEQDKSNNGLAGQQIVIGGAAKVAGEEGLQDFALLPNQPNPFNPSTQISYHLPQAGAVRLLVYNIMGQTVRVLEQSHRAAGTHRVSWDGRNDHGQSVAVGVYLYQLTSGAFQQTRHMLLLK